MSIVKYGDWEIDIDIEKTKQFYNTLKINDTSQVYRNFAKYCETLTKEEEGFFNAFGINPLLCKVESVGISKKYLPCGGQYYVYGKYISTPEDELIARIEEDEKVVEEIIKKRVMDDSYNPIINIGIFQFDFLSPVFEPINSSYDMPDGCICINFWCDDMPWLLDEKCELESLYPPRFWEIRRIIKKWKENRQFQRDYIENQKQDIVHSFKDAEICFEIMTEKEVLKYKKQWLSVFAPKDANMRELNKLCISSRKYTSFLWHLFSFEYLETPYEEQAQILFDKKPKDSAVLIVNTDNLGYRIHNLSNLNTDFFNEWDDITITASDFSWTYSKTHEEYLGPYYYER